MFAHATALVPAFRAEAFIQPTLDSLSEQTYGSFSVIVSVDACDDDTYAVCERHASRDSRFTVVRQDRRLGYVRNCNFLLSRASGDYACFAFHDDILLPSYVERLCALLEARPEAILAYSDVLVKDEVVGTAGIWTFSALENIRNPVARGLTMLTWPPHWPAPNRGLFRLQEAKMLGGLRSHGAEGYAPDFPWLFRLSLLGEFARVPEVLVKKYYKRGSLSKTWVGSKAQTNAALTAAWQAIWRSNLTLRQKLAIAIPTKWVLRARVEDILRRRS